MGEVLYITFELCIIGRPQSPSFVQNLQANRLARAIVATVTGHGVYYHEAVYCQEALCLGFPTLTRDIGNT